MRNIFSSIVALFYTFGTGVALAVVEEGSKLAPEPTVAVGWVYFFVFLFVGICVWIGYAIWSAEQKNRAAGTTTQDHKG